MKKQFLILGFSLCAACKQTDSSIPVPAPDAAKTIAGTYTANKYVAFDTKPYPINGKTITLQIDRISPDTVRIKVHAPANGSYSPARDTTYDKVYVLTKPQGYYLTLEADTTKYHQLGSQLTVSPGWASYTFVPPGYTLGNVSAELTKAN